MKPTYYFMRGAAEGKLRDMFFNHSDADVRKAAGKELLRRYNLKIRRRKARRRKR